ncbi:Chemotaxis response regulator containing a CheY-like receiver domain and a methylesterase domain [Agrobacterium tumefaciens str. Kerr 14]|uniref:protein-glutamate methylesterase n=1 Tax=Agrobacterium tumefaciens str. Kerr 14 TaxID=1183424 RepID=A0A1S7SFK8_AGRTU|nr:chemotaxis protein CheB [Agrobacterium tumefaciens]CUX68066.1 Chemotaxis response regulator containing a CheY-like receiver domain and a methylesterase domain [Agrobacterium tumefaciens str. Kerr 14]
MPNRNVVAIGGSAGSTKPLNAILEKLPHDLKAAIIIVIHVPSESIGLYSAIASRSPIPVVTAQDGMAIESGKVFIAPPDHHLLLMGDVFKLGKGPRENLARPAIDPLFRSVALSAGSRAIGLILSGMLNDGASGLAAIKKCGGIALVQAPNMAEAAAMPIAALEATPVDLSAGEAELAAAIVRYVEQEAGPPQPVPRELKLEVDIAAGAGATTKTIAKLGHPVALTCPDCGGVLSEVEGSRPLRFRCQVGHALSAKTLLADQQSAVDEAMRVALRIIEERAELVSRMGRDARASGREGIAENFLKKSDEYRGHADTLRQALLQLMEAEPDDLDEPEIASYEVPIVLKNN